VQARQWALAPVSAVALMMAFGERRPQRVRWQSPQAHWQLPPVQPRQQEVC
jgi:hypothetical protein